MEEKKEKQLSKKVYTAIFSYIRSRDITLRELSLNVLKIPYTTLFTWVKTLEKGKCISVKNIIFLEKKLGISLIFF